MSELIDLVVASIRFPDLFGVLGIEAVLGLVARKLSGRAVSMKSTLRLRWLALVQDADRGRVTGTEDEVDRKANDGCEKVRFDFAPVASRP